MTGQAMRFRRVESLLQAATAAAELHRKQRTAWTLAQLTDGELADLEAALRAEATGAPLTAAQRAVLATWDRVYARASAASQGSGL
jgi:uncharacterized protein YjiS (DUF1127 family)